MYCYAPWSKHANGSGKVMEHVYNMEVHIGRLLVGDECVHHIDRNRKNNEIDNLQLMTMSEHAKLHALEDGRLTVETLTCKCGREFTNKNVEYCSITCYRSDQCLRMKFNPTYEELSEMVWNLPMTKVGIHYGVSDVAIKKRCKTMGIDTPPRGYFIRKSQRMDSSVGRAIG